MTKLSEMRIPDYLAQAASNAPAPGGGSVAALVAALGSSLGQMVLSLSYGKKSYESLDDQIKAKLEAHEKTLIALRERFIELIDLDTEAFLSYMACMRMPKETDEEKAVRKEKMDECAIYSMEVPLETAETCVKMIECLPDIAEYGNKNAVTDAGVASLLARAACEAAIFNVRINLPTIADNAIREDADQRCVRALERVSELNEKLVQVVYSKI